MSNHDFESFVTSKNVDERVIAARLGLGLSKLLYDPEPEVRWEVAQHGYGMDVLVHDPDKYVRAQVAEQGYGLEELVKDDDLDVLVQVITSNRNNPAIAVLAKHPMESVRFTMAESGMELDTLKDDESELVRREALRQIEHKHKNIPSINVTKVIDELESVTEGRVILISKALVENALLKMGYKPEDFDVDALINELWAGHMHMLQEGVTEVINSAAENLEQSSGPTA